MASSNPVADRLAELRVAPTPEPVQKWAGQPSFGGGLGSSMGSPTDADAAYDPQKKPRQFSEVGISGLAQYGGFVRDEFLPQLQGDRALHVYREMWDNDPIVAAIVFAIQMLLRKVEWRVEPPEAATVEDIVTARLEERIQQQQERAQAQQQKLMMAQAGLANKAPGQPGGAKGPIAPGSKPGQVAPPKMPTPSLAGAPGPTPFHQPIPSPQQAATAGTTPPDKPGPNPPAPGLQPGSNSPSLTGVPNKPDTNPSGSPAQSYALGGEPGFGQGGGTRGKDKTNNPFTKFARMVNPFAKAGAPSAGGSGGGAGIDMTDPSTNPTDPETGEPMEFADGSGVDDITPEARKALELAVFVETCLHDLDVPWAEVLSQIITMIVFGFSFHEIVYKKRNGPNPDMPEQGSRFSDGKVGWAKLASRAQETRHRWEFDDTGAILGFWQLAPPKYQLRYIPMAKGLLFRSSAYKNNPEGRSALRSAYRPWYFLKRIQEFEAIGVERDLGGLPVAYVPAEMMSPSATPQETAALNAIKEMVKNLKVNQQMGVVMPLEYDPIAGEPVYKLELLSAAGSSKAFDTDKIISRYEQRIAMSVLADFILLGHEDTGARSLGETKADLFTTALEAWLSAIADEINTNAIPRLLQCNGEDPALCPKLTFGKLENVSLEEIAALLTAMTAAGFDIAPDTELEDFLREKAGMPAKAAGDDL